MVVKPTTTPTTTTTVPPVNVAMIDSLKVVLATQSDDWERRNTSMDGISIVRAPATPKKGASLMVEVHHAMSNFRNKLSVKSPAELNAYRELINDPRLDALMASIAAANGTSAKPVDDAVIVI